MNYLAKFFIQLGHPKIGPGPFPEFETVREAFLHLFRTEEESSYLFWSEIPIRLRYREEFFHNFDPILAIVWLIQRDEQGATNATFVTQLLFIDLEFRWKGSEVTISGAFTSIDDLYEPYARALNRVSELQIKKQAFLGEWKTLLHQIIVAFQAGRIEIRDGTERRKWEMLQRVEQQIPHYGRFYVRPE